MFRYRLEPLLRFRKRQEDEKMRELAFINAEMAANDMQERELLQSRAEQAEKMAQVAMGTHNIGVLEVFRDYINGLDFELSNTRLKQRNIAGRMEEKRKELVEYVRRRRVLEVHRDRHRERYDLELQREEQRDLDEIATQLYFADLRLQGESGNA